MKKIALFSILLLLMPNLVQAGSLTGVTVSPSNYTISTGTNITITFTTPQEIPADGRIYVDLFNDGTAGTFSKEAGLDYTDYDVSVGGVDQILAADNSTNAMGVEQFDDWFYIHLKTNAAIPLGSEIIIQIGTNATFGSTGDKQWIAPSSSGTALTAIRTDDENDGALDSGSQWETISAAAPEFSDFMMILILVVGGMMTWKMMLQQKQNMTV